MKKTLRRITGALVFLLAVASLCRIVAVIPARAAMRELERTLSDAERITITQGPMTQTSERIGSVLADVADAHDISDFFHAIDIRPSLLQLFAMRCMCGGDYKVAVSRGDTEPFVFGVHHGQSIRLPDTFWGDARLTAGSAFELARWFSKHGVFKEEEDVQHPAGG